MSEAPVDRGAEDVLTARRIVGLAFVALGIVALLWGGIFWTKEETVLDAGPLEVTSESREGVRIPSVVGAIALIAGVALVLIPDRRRV